MIKRLFISFLVLGTVNSGSLFSSGFALIEQSVSSMGNAFAGAAASAEDASTIFFNPAGMTKICETQTVIGFHGIFPREKFKDTGSILSPTIAGAAGVPQPLTGGDGGNIGVPAVVGNLYFVKNFNDRIWIGLGINAPFGLVTEYNDGWKGRYHALRSELLSININPSVAFKLNRCLSIGAGFSAMYLRTILTNAVDYGSIAWATSLTLPPATQAAVQAGLAVNGFLPQTQDGYVKLKGDSWGFGGNVGILWEPTCRTRIGVHLRSSVKHDLHGYEKFRSLPPFVANPALAGGLQAFFQGIQAAAATDASATAEVMLPLTVSVSGYHELNPYWVFLADVSWTKWDVLDALIVKFGNPNQPNNVLTTKWNNSFRYSAGVTYRPDCRWTFRTGIAYDQTPANGKQFTTPRIPDSDRFWIAGGVGYQWNQYLHFDLAYVHIFAKDPKIDKTGFTLPEDTLRGGLRGFWKNPRVDIISAQMVWQF